MNKAMQKILVGLKKDLEAGEKLYSQAFSEYPLDTKRIASAMNYLNCVVQKYMQYGFMNIYEEEMKKYDSENTIQVISNS